MARLFEVPEDSLAAKRRQETPLARARERFEDWKESVTETPLYQRVSGAAQRGYGWARKAFGLGSWVAWVGATSALVLVVPLVYEIDKELDAGGAGASGAGTVARPAGAS
ncbi:hypothetical protein CDCA_CDCA13G3629 [Cyanidium caldarium]|uniref:Mitochondrial import receptor subunit TOM22 n=1 Tax=Cyanidium caldarium TaxID=2771 RepID=A0AAV9IZV0_CYACA|nr:hypothetical protein CDCA_CDCA13G3629 [Cyanidium caldarium]